MVYVAAYLLTTYGIAVALAAVTLRVMPMRRLAMRLLVVIVLLAAPLAPYGLVHLQTLIFKDALLKPARAEHMVFYGSVRDAKVLRIWPRSALLYVVVSNRTGGDFAGFTLRLVRSNKEWKYIGDFDCIWSESGSADGNVFPPYPAKGD